MPNMFNGTPVILSQWLVKAGEPQEVRRSWRERLFSRPWRPFKATYTVVPQVPSDQILHTAQGFIMHPEMWRRLNAQLVQRPTPEGTQP